MHKTPIGLTAFLMQIRRQLSPAAGDGGRQDLFVGGNIVSDIEFVAEPFTAKDALGASSLSPLQPPGFIEDIPESKATMMYIHIHIMCVCK